MKISKNKLKQIVSMALREDLGDFDVTSQIALEKGARYKGKIRAREAGVLSGLNVARKVFKSISAEVTLKPLKNEGDRFKKGETLAEVKGPAAAVMAGERTALNFLQFMCAIATLTSKYVEAVQGTGAKIYDTRKTVPGHRMLSKIAVRAGGGENHRYGLYDQVLIKDNHIDANMKKGAKKTSVIEKLTARAAMDFRQLIVEVEVENVAEARAALRGGANIILLDNFTPTAFQKARKQLEEEARILGVKMPALEASGGIALKNVRKYAEAGADRISVGKITAAAGTLDIGLDTD